MRTKFKIVCIYLVIFVSSCTSSRLATKPESWNSLPDKSTSRIRLVTHMEKNALQTEFITRVLQRGMSIDTTVSRPGHLWSTIARSENYYVRFLVETVDSTVTISGQFGNLGLGGIGQTATVSNVAWSTITYNSKGWEGLSVLATLRDAMVQYNSTL